MRTVKIPVPFDSTRTWPWK